MTWRMFFCVVALNGLLAQSVLSADVNETNSSLRSNGKLRRYTFDDGQHFLNNHFNRNAYGELEIVPSDNGSVSVQFIGNEYGYHFNPSAKWQFSNHVQNARLTITNGENSTAVEFVTDPMCKFKKKWLLVGKKIERCIQQKIVIDITEKANVALQSRKAKTRDEIFTKHWTTREEFRFKSVVVNQQ